MIDWRVIFISSNGYFPWGNGIVKWTKFVIKLYAEIMGVNKSFIYARNACKYHVNLKLYRLFYRKVNI